MVFVFCTSYLSIADTINAVASEPGDEFLVITSNASIADLFSVLYTPNQVLLLPSVSIRPSRPVEFVRGQMAIRRAKKLLLPLLSSLSPDRMIFFFIGFNGLESWILKKLSATSQVYYRPGVSTDYLRRSFDLRVWIVGVLAGLSYGVLFIPRRTGEYSFLSVSMCFLKRIGAREFRHELALGPVADALTRAFPDIPEFDVLFLVEGGAVNVERGEYNRVVSRVLKEIARHVDPVRIAIKLHPDEPDPDAAIPPGCVTLPKFLPASLLLFKSRLVISYASGTLFEAVNNGKPAISMLRLLSPVAAEQVSAAERYLTANANDQIYFPETLEDLIETVVKTLSSPI